MRRASAPSRGVGESGTFQLWVGSAGNVANVEVLPIANSNSELENGTGNIGTGNIGNWQQSRGSWIDVSAAGIVPEPWCEYEMRFVFDYRKKTVSAAILDEDTGEYSPLASTSSGATEYPLASDAKRLAQIDFDGDTDFASLLGEDSDILHPTVFMLQ